MSINYVKLLKQDLKENAIKLGKKGTIYESAFVFENIEDNFHQESIKNIKQNELWNLRLEKSHTSFEEDVAELQSNNSSDALLMNIFCHPMIKRWKGVRDLLNIEEDDEIILGWRDIGFENERGYKTEVDMKIGNYIFEAKLTEGNFINKELSTVLPYENIDDVFEIEKLIVNKDKVKNYQLIRNILVAYKYNHIFNVILDQRRIDLIRKLLETVAAVKDNNLRSRIGFITWQEIASVCGEDLKIYLEEKYFAMN